MIFSLLQSNSMQDLQSADLDDIQAILYPKYEPDCFNELFLAAHHPLFEALRRFDRTPLRLDSPQDEAYHEHLTMQIISLLNHSCSHCPRREFAETLRKLLADMKGNLKNLAVGRMSLRISSWQQALDIGPFPNFFYECTPGDLRGLADQLYQVHRRIPAREALLMHYTSLAIAKERFEKILGESESSLPLAHQSYLAVIAAATYGCKYQWSRAVQSFLKVGGDPAWLEQGITAAAPSLQEMSSLSALLAYDFRALFDRPIFARSSSAVDNEYKLEALLLLSYYQALCCLDLVCGLIPENADYDKYLPEAPSLRPSLESFETVRRTEGKGNLQELKMAEEFTNLYSWEGGEQEEQTKIALARSVGRSGSEERRKRIESVPELGEGSIYLLGRAEEEEVCAKVGGLQFVKHLRRLYGKFVDFAAAGGERAECDPILSSDWEFEIRGLNRIESSLGSRWRQGLAGVVGGLRVGEGERWRRLKAYYEFFSGYMHEYISYTKLVRELSTTEKNYLKLVTKSPFLFTETTFQRMKQDLGGRDIDVLDFLLEATSYKLELSANLVTYIFDKATEDDG